MNYINAPARAAEHGLAVTQTRGLEGALLSEYNVNIAEWRLERDSPGSTALSFINLDEAVPAAALAVLNALPQVIEARVIKL